MRYISQIDRAHRYLYDRI